MPGIQALVDRDVYVKRIEQLEAQVERLKGALISKGLRPVHVERIALVGDDVNLTRVDL